MALTNWRLCCSMKAMIEPRRWTIFSARSSAITIAIDSTKTSRAHDRLTECPGPGLHFRFLCERVNRAVETKVRHAKATPVHRPGLPSMKRTIQNKATASSVPTIQSAVPLWPTFIFSLFHQTVRPYDKVTDWRAADGCSAGRRPRSTTTTTGRFRVRCKRFLCRLDRWLWRVQRNPQGRARIPYPAQRLPGNLLIERPGFVAAFVSDAELTNGAGGPPSTAL